MKTIVTLNNFRDEFNASRPDNFSYEGLEVLYNHLCECEDSTGDELELDVIAFCCEYTEWKSLAEFNENNGMDFEFIEDIETAIEVGGYGFITSEY